MSAGTTTVRAVETLGHARDVSEPRASRGRNRFLNPLLILGVAIVGLAALFVLVYPLLSPYSATEPDFIQPTFADPSWSHPLGTDNFGRDTLTRLA